MGHLNLARGIVVSVLCLSACGTPAPAPTVEISPTSAPADLTPTSGSAPLAAPTRDPALGPVPWPDCTHPVNDPLPLPKGFPPFPFPPGFQPFQVQLLNNDPNRMQVLGLAPISLRDSTALLLDRMPKLGYQMGRGDSEPMEVEANFGGNGWTGGFKVVALRDCTDKTYWLAVLVRS